MKKDHREINPDGLEMFISILERLDFTYFRLALCLDMPIMTCLSRGKNEMDRNGQFSFLPFLIKKTIIYSI